MTKQNIRIYCYTFLFLLLNGCAGTNIMKEEISEQLYDRNQIDIISSSSDRKMVMIKDKASKELYCISSSPDFSSSYSDGDKLSGGALGYNVGIGDNATKGVTGFGGRDPAVLIARELMYRACEFILNTNADSKSANAIYFETLRIISKIATLSSQSIPGSTAISSNPIGQDIELNTKITQSLEE